MFGDITFGLEFHLEKANELSFDLSGQFQILKLSLAEERDIHKKLIGDDYDNVTPLLIKSVNIDALNFSEIREWNGSSWIYTQGVHELRQLEIEIRDINGGILYNNWQSIMYKLKDKYPEEQQWTIEIGRINSSTFTSLTGGQVQGSIICRTKAAILRGISGLRMDSEDSSISTFTVTFFYDPYPFVVESDKPTMPTTEEDDSSKILPSYQMNIFNI